MKTGAPLKKPDHYQSADIPLDDGDRRGRKRKSGDGGAGGSGGKRPPRGGGNSSSESDSDTESDTESESNKDSSHSSDEEYLSPEELAMDKRKKRVKVTVRAKPFTRRRKGARVVCPPGAGALKVDPSKAYPRGTPAAQSNSRAAASRHGDAGNRPYTEHGHSTSAASPRAATAAPQDEDDNNPDKSTSGKGSPGGTATSDGLNVGASSSAAAATASQDGVNVGASTSSAPARASQDGVNVGASTSAAAAAGDTGRVRVDASGNVRWGNQLKTRKEAKRWKDLFQKDLVVDEKLEPNGEGNRQSNLRARGKQRKNEDGGASVDTYDYIDSKFRTAFRNQCTNKKQLMHLRTAFGEFAESVSLRLSTIEDFSASAAGFRNVETRLEEIRLKINIPFTNQEDMRSAFECKATKQLIAHYIYLVGRQVTGKSWVNDMMSHVSKALQNIVSVCK